MKWLALDTSTDNLSVAVAKGTAIWHEDAPGGPQASTHLIATVLRLLAQAQLTLAELDAIAFGRGPGSFTGLRTACAVTQGLALGADRPVLPLDTLLAVAESARQQDPTHTQVLALLDARMGQVYAGAYAWTAQGWHTVQAPWLCDPSDLRWPVAWAHSAHDTGQVVAGNAWPVYSEAVQAALGAHTRACHALPSARALLALAPAAWAAGQAVPPEAALPLYIRDKVAQTTAEREAARYSGATPAP